MISMIKNQYYFFTNYWKLIFFFKEFSSTNISSRIYLLAIKIENFLIHYCSAKIFFSLNVRGIRLLLVDVMQFPFRIRLLLPLLNWASSGTRYALHHFDILVLQNNSRISYVILLTYCTLYGLGPLLTF